MKERADKINKEALELEKLVEGAEKMRHEAEKEVILLQAEDASGLTFEEWDPTKDVDNSQPPVPMIINSSELRGAGFNLQEVIPPALEAAARSGRRTRGAGVRQVEGLGRKRFVLSADDDNDLRSRCE